ncbi:MAG: uracil-DNA glycosylase family protein [Campylobacterota bacterium]
MKTDQTFVHRHPFAPVVFDDTTKLIVGTLPPPRFSIEGAPLKDGDVFFCYGSADNTLWRIIDAIYGLGLEFAPTQKAIDQRMAFLQRYKIGICDIVESCTRTRATASDTGMKDIVPRDLLGILRRHPKIDTLLLMGGGSKNGPEYFLRRKLKSENIALEATSTATPKRHEFSFEGRKIEAVSLTSPSNAANRSIGANALYKENKRNDPRYTTFDFRCDQYRRFLPK